MRSVKTISALVLLVSLMLLGVAHQATRGVTASCVNRELLRQASPEGTHIAFLFQRDCGPEKGVSTQVSLIPADREFNQFPGNVLATDNPSGAYELEWRDARTLVIRGVDGTIIRQRGELGSVRIVYE